ncbi:helix-turn-helix domain-containing protein [Kitasatospora sp. NPDC028055]|uniref:helix-turn-helix domain-containing protein n=1 Tax=Kitasatospora sp. NPDC028055 TaxID=3155653 RepID=UPI0033FE3B37
MPARADVSRTTLNHRSTAPTSHAPTTHRTSWRTTRTAALLRRGTNPLETVARTVGHTGPHTLSHAFAREFATTPGRHRTTTTPTNRHPHNTRSVHEDNEQQPVARRLV